MKNRTQQLPSGNSSVWYSFNSLVALLTFNRALQRITENRGKKDATKRMYTLRTYPQLEHYQVFLEISSCVSSFIPSRLFVLAPMVRAKAIHGRWGTGLSSSLNFRGGGFSNWSSTSELYPSWGGVVIAFVYHRNDIFGNWLGSLHFVHEPPIMCPDVFCCW